MLGLLRLRSELRKFVRKQVPPRRGRSHSKIMSYLHANEINTIADWPEPIRPSSGQQESGEKEVTSLLSQARDYCNDKALRTIGVRDQSALLRGWHPEPRGLLPVSPGLPGVSGPGSARTPRYRHAEMVCLAQNRPVPRKVTRAMLERARRTADDPRARENTIEMY